MKYCHCQHMLLPKMVMILFAFICGCWFGEFFLLPWVPFCFPHLAFWCDRELARCPAKCTVSISPSIRAASSSPTHHTCGRLILQPRVNSSLGIWAECQPAWGMSDFWFHSDSIPDWAGGCSQSHLVRFPLFVLKYGKYFRVNPSFLNCGYVPEYSLGDAGIHSAL